MSIEEFFTWAKEHHYPRLVLSKKEIVKPGQAEWEKLQADTSGRVERALDRVQTFLDRVSREKIGA